MVEATPAYLADRAAFLRTLRDDATGRGEAVTHPGPNTSPLPLRPLPINSTFAGLIDNAVDYGGVARVTLADR